MLASFAFIVNKIEAETFFGYEFNSLPLHLRCMNQTFDMFFHLFFKENFE